MAKQFRYFFMILVRSLDCMELVFGMLHHLQLDRMTVDCFLSSSELQEIND